MAWWTRTNHNRPGGDILLNDPDGWMIERPDLHWLGPDTLNQLLAQGRAGTGYANDEAAWGTLEQGGGGFPAITRATSLICDTLGGVPMEVIRGRETLASPRWLADPQLARPDERIPAHNARGTGIAPLSGVAFWTQAFVCALWYGDAFIWVPQRDLTTGQPIPPIHSLHPLLIDVRTPFEASLNTDSSDRPPGYWLKLGDGTFQPLPIEQIIHVRGMAPYWLGRGRGAITGHLRSWDEAAQQRSYSTGIFTAGIPAGYLKVSSPNLTEPQADALRAKWEEKHGTLTQRSIAVLNSTTDFVPVQLPPESAQLSEGKKSAILDVANAFGVEPYLLGLPADGLTYQNVEAQGRSFLTYSILPWARRLESVLDAEFPLGTTVRLNLEGLARADSAARVTYYTAGLDKGWLTIDEVRRAEGLPDLATVAPAPVAQETALTAGRTTEANNDG